MIKRQNKEGRKNEYPHSILVVALQKVGITKELKNQQISADGNNEVMNAKNHFTLKEGIIVIKAEHGLKKILRRPL